VSALLAASNGNGYEAPGAEIFWQPWFGSGQWTVTRSVIVALLSIVVLSWWLLASTRRRAMVPGRAQFFTEQVYGLVRNSVGRDIIGSREFLTYVPLLFALFVFILLNNLFGIIPPIQFPTLSRIGFPIALTLIVYVVYHTVGIRRFGVVGYFKHMIPAGVPGWVLGILVPLELLTYFFTRPVTLALRVWGNMFAGHLLLVLFVTGAQWFLFDSGKLAYIPLGIFTYLFAFVMTIFEALVEFLQAYIFVLLTALYIAGSLADEH
jgi:F-type H+-transporting ATPase subunit a